MLSTATWGCHPCPKTAAPTTKTVSFPPVAHGQQAERGRKCLGKEKSPAFPLSHHKQLGQEKAILCQIRFGVLTVTQHQPSKERA